MKSFWFAMLVTGNLLISHIALAQDKPAKAMLLEMVNASKTLSYQLLFVDVQKQLIEPQRYRHAKLAGKEFSQLIKLDGAPREVIQRNNTISFIEFGQEPFSLAGDHIVDALPAAVFANYESLSRYYDFILLGRAREADRLCSVIRIVDGDESRYSYVLWLDEETHLPMRADLLDRDGTLLEQFRVMELTLGQSVEKQLQELQSLSIPPLIHVPERDKIPLAWQVSWIPQGFREISQGRRELSDLAQPVESRLYSDGLFSFSVSLSPVDTEGAGQVLRQARRTILTESRDRKEVLVIGEIPPETAKKIADSVQWQEKP